MGTVVNSHDAIDKNSLYLAVVPFRIAVYPLHKDRRSVLLDLRLHRCMHRRREARAYKGTPSPYNRIIMAARVPIRLTPEFQNLSASEFRSLSEFRISALRNSGASEVTSEAPETFSGASVSVVED